MINSAPIPLSDPIARPKRQGYVGKDPLEGTATDPWISWLSELSNTVSDQPTRISLVTLNSQSASISATDLSPGGVTAGHYRISYYARITQAATTSSSLTVSFDWSDSGVTPSHSGAAITGNTTTTVQSGSILVYSDTTAPIRYSTAYSSTGATAMQYRLSVLLEQIRT